MVKQHRCDLVRARDPFRCGKREFAHELLKVPIEIGALSVELRDERWDGGEILLGLEMAIQEAKHASGEMRGAPQQLRKRNRSVLHLSWSEAVVTSPLNLSERQEKES